MKKLIKLTVLCLMSMLALAVVTACKPKHEITGIEIKDKPTKEWYYVDDAAGLQLAGGMITVKYADNVNEEIEMTDAEVAVTGFDSSAPNASLKLTVTYKNKTASFNVEIKVDPVTGVAVSSTGFKSLYFTGEALSVNTVKITYESGKTDDMAFDSAKMTVSGYNATLVQEQTVTLTYEGKLCTFKVKVIGEDKITPLLAKIEELEKLDWTSGIPEANAATMEIANDAFDIYAGLNADYRTFITLTQMRPAIALVFMPYYKEYERLKNAILLENKYIDDDDRLIISDITTLQDFSKLVKDITALIGEMKDKFTAYALSEIEKDHRLGSDYLTPAVNWLAQKGGMLNSYADSITAAVNALEIFKDEDIELYPDDLLPYEDALLDICEIIFGSNGTVNDINNVVMLERDDLCDILLRFIYYYSDYSEDEVLDKITAVANVYLPDILVELASWLLDTHTFWSYTFNLRIYDITYFMVCYREAARMIDSIYKNDDLLSIFIYESVELNNLLFNSNTNEPVPITLWTLFYAVRTYNYSDDFSYYWWMDQVLGDRIFESFFNYYLDIASKLMLEDSYLESPDFEQDVEELYRRFIYLSPMHQFHFFTAIDAYYKLMWNGEYNFYYISDDLYISFFYMLDEYNNNSNLSNAEKDLFTELMHAVELYALWQSEVFTNSQYFILIMDECIKMYDDMAVEPGSLLDELYSKYYEIYLVLKTANYSTDWGEWASDIQQLMVYFGEMDTMIYHRSQNNYATQMFFFTSYYNAIEIHDRIMTDASQDIINAYFNYICYDGYSLGNTMYYFQFWYVRFMTYDYGLYQYDVGGTDLWDFLTPDLEAFIALAHHAYWAYFNGLNAPKIYDNDIMKEMNIQFRELTIEEQYAFLQIFAGWLSEYYHSYYDIITQYYGLKLTGAELSAAIKLFSAESYYVYAAYIGDEAAMAGFMGLMKECMEFYDDITDKTKFNSYLEEMYEYYRAKYEELKGEESESALPEEVAEAA